MTPIFAFLFLALCSAEVDILPVYDRDGDLSYYQLKTPDDEKYKRGEPYEFTNGENKLKQSAKLKENVVPLDLYEDLKLECLVDPSRKNTDKDHLIVKITFPTKNRPFVMKPGIMFATINYTCEFSEPERFPVPMHRLVEDVRNFEDGVLLFTKKISWPEFFDELDLHSVISQNVQIAPKKRPSWNIGSSLTLGPGVLNLSYSFQGPTGGCTLNAGAWVRITLSFGINIGTCWSGICLNSFFADLNLDTGADLSLVCQVQGSFSLGGGPTPARYSFTPFTIVIVAIPFFVQGGIGATVTVTGTINLDTVSIGLAARYNAGVRASLVAGAVTAGPYTSPSNGVTPTFNSGNSPNDDCTGSSGSIAATVQVGPTCTIQAICQLNAGPYITGTYMWGVSSSPCSSAACPTGQGWKGVSITAGVSASISFGLFFSIGIWGINLPVCTFQVTIPLGLCLEFPTGGCEDLTDMWGEPCTPIPPPNNLRPPGNCIVAAKKRMAVCRSAVAVDRPLLTAKREIESDYHWYTGQWSDCSADCGQGLRTRDVFCATNENDDDDNLDQTLCKGTKPPAKEICMEAPCVDCPSLNCSACLANPICVQCLEGGCKFLGYNSPTFVCGEDNIQTSACSNSEPFGNATFSIVGQKYRLDWQGGPPNVVISVIEYDYPLDTQKYGNIWVGGGLLESVTNEHSFTWVPTGFRSGVSAFLLRGADERIEGYGPFTISQNVTLDEVNNVGTYSYFYQAWSSCSVKCGGGEQSRIVECRDHQGAVVDPSFCSDYTLKLTRNCNNHDCPNFPLSLLVQEGAILTGSVNLSWAGGQVGGLVLLRISASKSIHYYTSPFHGKVTFPADQRGYPYQEHEDYVLYFGPNNGSVIVDIPEFIPVSDTYVLVISPADVTGHEFRPLLASVVRVSVTKQTPLQFMIQIAEKIDEDVTFRLFGWFEFNVTLRVTGDVGETVVLTTISMDPGNVSGVVVNTNKLQSLLLKTSTGLMGFGLRDTKPTILTVNIIGSEIQSQRRAQSANPVGSNTTFIINASIEYNCFKFPTCGTCSPHASCGWCQSSGCQPVNLDNKPTIECHEKLWAYDIGDCKAVATASLVPAPNNNFLIFGTLGFSIMSFCLGLFVAAAVQFAVMKCRENLHEGSIQAEVI